MAAALDEREQRLIRSERLAAVGKIAAQITHEVRNPLSSIGLNAELLEEELGSLGDAARRRPGAGARDRQGGRSADRDHRGVPALRAPAAAQARARGPAARSSRRCWRSCGQELERRAASRSRRSSPPAAAGRRRRAPAAAGAAQPAAQRRRGDARRRPARRSARATSTSGAASSSRIADTGAGHRARAPGEDLRSVLLDQGGRHRPRAGADPADHRRARRHDRRAQRARARHHLRRPTRRCCKQSCAHPRRCARRVGRRAPRIIAQFLDGTTHAFHVRARAWANCGGVVLVGCNFSVNGVDTGGAGGGGGRDDSRR